MNNSAGFLLDTHIWIWLINGETLLEKKLLNILIQAAKDNAVFLAAISLWEVSMLVAKERIILDKPVLEWINMGLQAPGVSVIPLAVNIAVESSQLPGEFHGDPADRMIIATSRTSGLTLVTRDQKILDYGKKHYINVIKG